MLCGPAATSHSGPQGHLGRALTAPHHATPLWAAGACPPAPPDAVSEIGARLQASRRSATQPCQGPGPRARGRVRGVIFRPVGSQNYKTFKHNRSLEVPTVNSPFYNGEGEVHRKEVVFPGQGADELTQGRGLVFRLLLKSLQDSGERARGRQGPNRQAGCQCGRAGREVTPGPRAVCSDTGHKYLPN